MVLELKIPQDATRREAMAKMHRQTAIFLKTVMLEAQKEYSDVQNTKAAKQTFAIMCDTLWTKATDCRAFEQLELEAPLRTLDKDLFMNNTAAEVL